MKSIFYILLLLPFLLSCGGNNSKDNNYMDLIDMKNPPELSFEEKTFDFGTVIEGRKVDHRYNFTNTGRGSLIIQSVTGSCGCTVAKNWPKTPIEPGESAFIDVTFNTEGWAGKRSKIINITANTQPTTTKINIKGTIIGPDNK